MTARYQYSVRDDFPNKKVNVNGLTDEINAKIDNKILNLSDSTRTNADGTPVFISFDGVTETPNGETISVAFGKNISGFDKLTLNEIISKHEGDDLLGDIGTVLNYLDDSPNFRTGAGITNRDKQIMTWRLPNGSSVQMYINPQNFVVAESKQITPTRTKGGFVVQYWGDNLTKLTLSGTTGSSGVRGIQVLRDIYRAENRAFELVAAQQANDLQELAMDGVNFDTASIFVKQVAEDTRARNIILRPSLASLALSILLFYQGIQYRGFFTDFTMTENVSSLGLFDYNINFTVTETRGSRENFLAWHKEPLADSQGGQLISGTLNYVGNSIRSAVGLPEQAQNPIQFHPESAPLSFGGSVLGTNPLSALVDMM